MAKEDFDLFWTTHLTTTSHGCNLPEVTVLYYHTAKEETSNFPWTRREGTGRLHATAAVARDLLTQVRVATRRNLFTATLIQNYSPCSHCAEEILKTVALAQEKRIKFDISIAFVALNRIRRPSWIWRGLEAALHGVPLNEANDNAFALKQLHEAGVKLSTFNPDTWRFLHTFLGNGLPMENHGKILGGKYSNMESRQEEDKLMEADFRQVLRGLMITSPSICLSSSMLDIEWSRPSLAGQKVSEYNIVCKKVTVKNKDDDARLWRIYQTLDKIGVKVTVSGELRSCILADLDLDTFYDVTVEAVARGLSVCVGRKLFRTGNKVPIASLQTPTTVRKSTTPARPRTSSVTTFNGSPATDPPVRLRRSNSIQTANGGHSHAAGSTSETTLTARAAFLRRSTSDAAEAHTATEDEFDNQPKSRPVSSVLSRSSSLCSTSDKSPTNSQDGKRKVPSGNKPAISFPGKGDASGGRKISASSIASTML